MRSAIKTLALAALLAASSPAGAAAPERINRTTGKHSLEHRTTEKRRHDLRVPQGSRSVRLHFKATLREGEMKILVHDAEGRVRQDARIGPSKSKPNVVDVDTGAVRSPAGVWTIEVELKDARGGYEYTFTADLGD